MKSLVDIMGGTISVKSELGKGTEFIVDLYVPLAEAEVEEHSEENITENLMDARILLVEDSEILEAGMNYHLSKPINPKTLYNILSNHLTGKEA